MGQLVEYKPDKYNVLMPTQHIEQVSPWHAARTTVVQVNPDPMSGDVFKVGSRYNEATREYEDIYSLAKPALMRIAAAAGIVWNWRDSGPRVLQRDYVCYRAVGALRLPDGSWQPIMAEKEIDLSVVEEELRDQYAKKADGPLGGTEAKAYRGEWRKVRYGNEERNAFFLAEDEKSRFIEANVHANLIQWRKNKLMRAETGAMLRVIRAALGIKSQYTFAELQKPFVVPRIDFSPDYNDPSVRQALIQHGVAAMGALFGAATPPAPQVAFPERPAIAAPIQDDETVEAGATSLEAEPNAADLGDVEEALEMSAEEFTGEAEAFGDQAPSSDGTLFPPEPAPAPESAQVKPRSVVYGTCADCGAQITSGNVVSYSHKKFGRVLCYKCQNKAKGAAANA
ncbi:MAG: hypothetical protein AB1563_00215 [Bacillota bacterium]